MDQFTQFLSSSNITQTFARWQTWNSVTWHEINEIIQLDGSNQFTLYQLLTHALQTTKVTLVAWSKFVFPISLFFLKVLIHILLFFVEVLKWFYALALPHLQRTAHKATQAYHSLDERTKILIFLFTLSSIIVYLLGKWIFNHPLLKSISTKVKTTKQGVQHRYQSFVAQLREKSLLLAQVTPHLLFALLFGLTKWFNFNLDYFVSLSSELVPLFNSQTNDVSFVEPIGLYTLFPFALCFPILSSIYHAVVASYLLEDKWLRLSAPKLNGNWIAKNERKFHSIYQLQYFTHFYGSSPMTPTEQSNQTPPPDSQLVSFSPFLTTLSNSMIGQTNYWIALAFFGTLYNLPLTGHLIAFLINKYHTLPFMVLLWLLSPLTSGGNTIVWIFHPILSLLRHIPVLNMFCALPQLPSTIPTSNPFPTSSPHEDTVSATLQLPPALQHLSNGTLNPTPPSAQNESTLSKFINSVLNLPIIPGFIKNMLSQSLSESGLLLYATSLGLITPTFITSLLSIIALFIRPFIVSVGLSSNLQSILAIQDTIDQQSTPSQTPETQRALHHYKQLLKDQQLYLLRRLGWYLWVFMINTGLQFLSRLPILSSLPLVAQLLLGASLYVQTPLFHTIPLLASAFEPAIRHTFFSYHINALNLRTQPAFLDQRKAATWDPLFAPCSPPTTPSTSTSPPGSQKPVISPISAALHQQSGAFFPSISSDAPSLHFTSCNFQSGIAPTLSAGKNTVLAPLFFSFRSGSRRPAAEHDGSDDEDDGDDIPQPKQSIQQTQATQPTQPPQPTQPAARKPAPTPTPPTTTTQPEATQPPAAEVQSAEPESVTSTKAPQGSDPEQPAVEDVLSP